MNVLVIGWGSLIWDPRTLNMDGTWRSHGPWFPIEFARLSDGGRGRLTLTIAPGAPLVQTLFTISQHASLEHAISNLADREGCSSDAIGRYVVATQQLHAHREAPLLREQLQHWLVEGQGRAERVDAVIWTDLGPSFHDVVRWDFHLVHALEHLKQLRGRDWKRAAEYILRAPAQITTPMRPALEAFIHQCNLTDHFRLPLLGARSPLHPENELTAQDVWDIREEFLPEAHPVFWDAWINGLPGRAGFIGEHRIALQFEVPVPHGVERIDADGNRVWVVEGEHDGAMNERILALGGQRYRLHRR